jgi:hypothetical protein
MNAHNPPKQGRVFLFMEEWDGEPMGAEFLTRQGETVIISERGEAALTPSERAAITGRDAIVVLGSDYMDPDGIKADAATLIRKATPFAASVRVQDGLTLPDDASPDLWASFAEPAADWLKTVRPAAVKGSTREPTPFSFVPAAQIPRREWLYGHHMIRRFVSATVAPGGVGKSSLLLTEAMAMATGRNLLGEGVRKPLRVWYFNGEDPRDELQRRLEAVRQHYDVDPEEIGDRLFIDSGRERDLVIATQTKAGTVILEPCVEALVEAIRRLEIDVLVIDPFVSSHSVPENDNNAIDQVAKKGWGRVAELGNCAVELSHHVRKTGGEAATVEDARGGSALLAAVRSARVLNQMPTELGERYGLSERERRTTFSVENGKANLAPPPEGRSWFRLESVAILNGGTMDLDGEVITLPSDFVAVPRPWTPPDPLADVSPADLEAVKKAMGAKRWRKDHQSPDWAGHPVAKALGLDLEQPRDKAKVRALLAKWRVEGTFAETEALDKNRRQRAFLEVPPCADK